MSATALGLDPLRRAAACALERGRQAHRRLRCALRPRSPALFLVVVWAPLGIWAAWDALPRWGRVEWAVAAGDVLVVHVFYFSSTSAARLPAPRPHRRLPGGARHRPLLSSLGALLWLGEAMSTVAAPRRRRRGDRRVLHCRRTGPLGPRRARPDAARPGARRIGPRCRDRRPDRRLHPDRWLRRSRCCCSRRSWSTTSRNLFRLPFLLPAQRCATGAAARWSGAPSGGRRWWSRCSGRSAMCWCCAAVRLAPISHVAPARRGLGILFAALDRRASSGEERPVAAPGRRGLHRRAGVGALALGCKAMQARRRRLHQRALAPEARSPWRSARCAT